jgi:hypothetical protein
VGIDGKLILYRSQEPPTLVTIATTVVKDHNLPETSKLVRPFSLPSVPSSPSPFTFASAHPPPQPRAVYNGHSNDVSPPPIPQMHSTPLHPSSHRIKNLYDAKPAAIHILGRKAEGGLKRPFKAGGLFGGEWFWRFGVSFFRCTSSTLLRSLACFPHVFFLTSLVLFAFLVFLLVLLPSSFFQSFFLPSRRPKDANRPRPNSKAPNG